MVLLKSQDLGKLQTEIQTDKPTTLEETINLEHFFVLGKIQKYFGCDGARGREEKWRGL